MEQTSVFGVSSEIPIKDLQDSALELLWSKMVRERSQEQFGKLTALIRRERRPESQVEEQILEVGSEMAHRDLFHGCLV